MIWRCPLCRSELHDRGDLQRCTPCARDYEVISGIPDFRVEGDSWIDFETDSRFARQLAVTDQSIEQMVRSVYAARQDWDSGRIERRTREVLDGPQLMRGDVEGWLARTISVSPVLDLGCGNGPLMVAMLSAGRQCIGIDVSMTWLVVARKIIEHHGHKPVLAAALAEALPLADDSIGATVSLDVIEHVRNVTGYVREINRVVRPGGRLAISTPNRFSLSAEPHVFVWGVGWLPRKLQKRYVEWKSGKSYDDTVLLSSWELRRIFKDYTKFQVEITSPAINQGHIDAFSRSKAAAASAYNTFVSLKLFSWIFLIVGPFFRLTGTKVAE